MKKIISYITALLMTFSVIPTTACAIKVEETSSLSMEESQSEMYWIFYKQIDTTEIEQIAEEKRAEYIYQLYEQDLTQQEFELLSTDYYSKVRQELLEIAYSENSSKVLKELGIKSEDAFCSKFTNTIVCHLTAEQKVIAEKSDLIESISTYSSVELDASTETIAYTNKEEFINIITTIHNLSPHK